MATENFNYSGTQKPILNSLVANGQIAAGTLVLPANAVIREILVSNNTANAITGGLKFGTTAGGVDIAAALAVAANARVFVTDALLLLRYFSTSATQTIYFDAVTAWNSANVNVTILYYQL